MNTNRKLIALAAITASLALPVAAFAQSATTDSTGSMTAATQAHVCPAAAIAAELGLTKAEVKAALDANRPARGEQPTAAQKTALASALGISVTRLDSLMQEYGGKGGGQREPRLPIAQIATETGKTQAEVKAAFDANRPARGERPTGAQKASIAAALGLTVTEFESLMQEYAPKHAPAPSTGTADSR